MSDCELCGRALTVTAGEGEPAVCSDCEREVAELDRAAERYAYRTGGGDPARRSDCYAWFKSYYGAQLRRRLHAGGKPGSSTGGRDAE